MADRIEDCGISASRTYKLVLFTPTVGPDEVSVVLPEHLVNTPATCLSYYRKYLNPGQVVLSMDPIEAFLPLPVDPEYVDLDLQDEEAEDQEIDADDDEDWGDEGWEWDCDDQTR